MYYTDLQYEIERSKWMESLEVLREKLDSIDDQIAALYEQRMNVCGQVGEYKVKAGRKVFDRQREKEKLADVASKVSGDFNKKGIQELYQQLMSMSRKLQYRQLVEAGALGRLPFIQINDLDKQNARVVFQGTEGAYGQAAMRQFFGENVNSFHVRTFREAMESIEEGAADYAVLPIENSTAGPVIEMYDLLDEFENYIVAETILPVVHTLSGLPGAKLTDIKRVYSKTEALMQTSRFLDEHSDWQRISVVNTAIAAKKVLEENDISQAAVCSSYAAKVHGLSVLVDGINDDDDNSTRFIVVTNQKVFLKDASKISIRFELPHQSGSLYGILSHFIYNDLNMTKIESRPIKGRPWEYCFFVDFEGNLEDPAVKNAIRGLREESQNLKILGNY
jgi:chorismate mutase/prephenate dehydratase